MRRLFTIGYGGRKPEGLVGALQAAGVRTVVDVRLRPDRASMGAFTLAKTPDKGIQKLLSEGGVDYVSFVELGNLFLGFDNWPERYTALVAVAGEILTERLHQTPAPFCLMCSERDVRDCHRKVIADFLVKQGYKAEHIP